MKDNQSSDKREYLTSYIDTMTFDPKKDCSGLYIGIKCDQSDSCSIDALMKVFRDKGIPYQLVIDKTSSSQHTFYAVLDFTGRSQSRETVEKDLRALIGDKLISFEYINSDIPGLTCNVKSFPLALDIFGSQTLTTAFTHPFLSYMFRAIYETFGAGGLSIIWLSGREAVESMRPIKNLPLDNRQKMKVALMQLQILGWGKFELVEMNDKNCVVRVNENFECLATAGLKGYQSSFMRGVVTGLASMLTDKKGNCVEKKCIRNGDPYCEFSVE